METDQACPKLKIEHIGGRKLAVCKLDEGEEGCIGTKLTVRGDVNEVRFDASGDQDGTGRLAIATDRHAEHVRSSLGFHKC